MSPLFRRRREDSFTEIPPDSRPSPDPSFDGVAAMLGTVGVTAPDSPSCRNDAGEQARQAEELVARQARAYALYRDAWWAGTKGAGGCPPAGSGGALPASRLRPLEPHGRDQDPERITMATQEQERGLRGFRPTPDQRTFVSNILIWLWVITLSFTFAIGVAACYSVG